MLYKLLRVAKRIPALQPKVFAKNLIQNTMLAKCLILSRCYTSKLFLIQLRKDALFVIGYSYQRLVLIIVQWCSLHRVLYSTLNSKLILG